jgi:hypothetical protein
MKTSILLIAAMLMPVYALAAEPQIIKLPRIEVIGHSPVIKLARIDIVGRIKPLPEKTPPLLSHTARFPVSGMMLVKRSNFLMPYGV